MAFTGIAGRAGFVLELDKSQLDRGLPEADRQFSQATASMAASADRAGAAIGAPSRGGLVGKLGGMGSMLGKGGLVGIGITSALGAMNELQGVLKVSGSEAFTAEGKMRNFASSLMGPEGIVGGIKALGAQPRTLADLGMDAREAAANLDNLRLVSEKVGGRFTTIYEEAKLAAAGVRELDAAMRTVLGQSVGFRDPSGRLITGGPVADRPGFEPPIPSFGKSPSSDGTTPGATRLQNLELSAARARRHGDLDEQRNVQRRIVEIYRNRVENTRLTGQALVRFRTELSREQDQLDSLEDQIAAERQAKAEAAARVREKRERDAAQAGERRARERRAEAAQRREERERQWMEVATSLTERSRWRKRLDATSQAMNDLYGLGGDSPAKKDGAAFTEADFKRMTTEFLRNLQGWTNQFGGNLTADGAQTATNTWATAKRLEELVRGVDRLASSVAHPGARYARVALSDSGTVGV